MPKPNELTQMQFLNLFSYKAPEGKWYFNGASEVMRASGSVELDPIHFVRYALTDVFAPLAVSAFRRRAP